jgi:DNA-binding CsgD family transcriptional regulator
MNAVKTYKKPWLQRRNNQIAKFYLEGISQGKIAQRFGISLSNVSQIIHRMGGKTAITERLGSAPVPASLPDTHPTLDFAYDKLARIYITTAFDLHEDLMSQGTIKEKARYLKLLAPIVKEQVKRINLKPTNFHLNGATPEDLERQLLDYALEGANTKSFH